MSFAELPASIRWKSLCKFLHLFFCSLVLHLKFPLFRFIYGQPMCMKVHRWQSLLIFLLFQKERCICICFSALYNVFQPLDESWYNMLVLLAVATMIIGNLFAIRQQNMKRFLAFSSIAQVGFILVGISRLINNAGIASVIYFVLIYIFSNLAAFGVASAIVSAETGKENIDDYKGFYKTNPFLSWVLALALFSLAGIPPTAGFFGKFFLITAGAAKEIICSSPLLH